VCQKKGEGLSPYFFDEESGTVHFNYMRKTRSLELGEGGKGQCFAGRQPPQKVERRSGCRMNKNRRFLKYEKSRGSQNGTRRGKS